MAKRGAPLQRLVVLPPVLHPLFFSLVPPSIPFVPHPTLRKFNPIFHRSLLFFPHILLFFLLSPPALVFSLYRIYSPSAYQLPPCYIPSISFKVLHCSASPDSGPCLYPLPLRVQLQRPKRASSLLVTSNTLPPICRLSSTDSTNSITKPLTMAPQPIFTQIITMVAVPEGAPRWLLKMRNVSSVV